MHGTPDRVGAAALRRSWRSLAVAGLAALGVVAAALAGGAVEPAAAKPQLRPNIIVIVTDDMTLAQLSQATMPQTLELLGNEGTTLSDFVVTTPLCCPSRASFLSGQYGHNNGVLSNGPGYLDLIGKDNTLPVWLDKAGYETVHVGRYLNGYKQVGGKKPAPGWDQWYSALEPRKFYDYGLEVNGKTFRYGRKPKDYLTTVLNKITVRTIRKQAKRAKPFYIQLDHLAPHDEWRDTGGPCGASAIPAPGDLTPFATTPLPASPNFNEQDTSDKPAYIQALPPIDEFAIAEIQREWRCRLASLLEVDRGVQQIVSALAAESELDNTMISFMSDNGHYHGEHRIPFEKYMPYEEGIRVPGMIRFPASVGAVPVIDQPVSNLDITATILEMAGAAPCAGKDCRVIDGRSILPLARGETPDWVAGREIVIELDRRFSVGEGFGTRPCQYQGLRTATHVYLEHLSVPDPTDGLCREALQIELYDLDNDPYELQNMFPTKPGSQERVIQLQLADQLDVLRDCAGIAGRDPVPASGHYCE